MVIKHHEVVVRYEQGCDFCDKPAAYDGKTVHGPWAWMCEEHFGTYGPGETGLGKAQRIVKENA